VKIRCISFVFLLNIAAFSVCASGVPGSAVKGGIQHLIKTVVDVTAADKNSSDDYRNSDRRESSDGTGFIIDEDGYIVTNCHVIDATDKVKVVLYDGVEYMAKVIGRDDRSDIALLKIDAEFKLPFVQFADSDKVEIGDPVIAIGNPFGFGKTVTSGIVSFKGRNLSTQIAELGSGGDLVSYLQTDAAVNYGNSGGPLFTYNAEVAGMITVFFSDGMHSMGINFAIPSNTLKNVIKELREHGKIQRSWLGIGVSPLGRKAARALGLGKQWGCVIARIEKNSPAAVAGIQIGDILLSLNNEEIAETTNLEVTLNGLPIGKVIPIQIMRHGVSMKLSVMVGVRSDDDFYSSSDDISEKSEISYEKIDGIGVGVAELTQELRKSFDISDNVNGVMIAHVGNLQRNDVAIGSVILSINQMNVTSVADLKKELKKLSASEAIQKNKEIVLYVFDPQARRYDYIVVDFNPAISSLPPKRHPTANKVTLPKKNEKALVEKLKEGLKTQWRLI
jgi:serine protease Do